MEGVTDKKFKAEKQNTTHTQNPQQISMSYEKSKNEI